MYIAVPAQLHGALNSFPNSEYSLMHALSYQYMITAKKGRVSAYTLHVARLVRHPFRPPQPQAAQTVLSIADRRPLA